MMELSERDIRVIESFVARVNRRAEHSIAMGRVLEGAHYAAMRLELQEAQRTKQMPLIETKHGDIHIFEDPLAPPDTIYLLNAAVPADRFIVSHGTKRE